MVQHHFKHHHQIRKGGGGGGGGCLATEESSTNCCVFFKNTTTIKTTRPKLFYLLLLSISSCLFILAIHLFCSSSASLLMLYTFGLSSESQATVPLCSSVPSGSICCDRSNRRTDICFMEGDVRTDPTSFSISVYGSRQPSYNMSSSISRDQSGHLLQQELEIFQQEDIKPYTRKWETNTMATIDQLHLAAKNEMLKSEHHCDLWHDVPAVFFSTGGYTGNVYHEFNDGILPLYITSQHFNRNVVFVILEYHDWWISKYDDILQLLSRYPPIDFNGDKRKHCFPRAVVGLKIHDELTVDQSLMIGNKSIVEFRNLLDKAYEPRINSLNTQEISPSPLHLNSSQGTDQKSKFKKETGFKKPKLVIVSRNGSRAILNEDSLIKMAENIGFEVNVLKPNPTTELAKVYRALNSSDVMIGVHGAAMTHFLFMRPLTTFIQVIPLGTDWAAEAYYGEPAKKLGLNYIGYKILAKESSLYTEYDAANPVLKDPDSVNDKGWELTKKIYLDGQNVILNIDRFRRHLISAYDHVKLTRIKHLM